MNPKVPTSKESSPAGTSLRVLAWLFVVGAALAALLAFQKGMAMNVTLTLTIVGIVVIAICSVIEVRINYEKRKKWKHITLGVLSTVGAGIAIVAAFVADREGAELSTAAAKANESLDAANRDLAAVRSELQESKAREIAIMKASQANSSAVERLEEIVSLLNRDSFKALSESRAQWKQAYNDAYRKGTEVRSSIRKADTQLADEYTARWLTLTTLLLADLDQAVDGLEGVTRVEKRSEAFEMFTVDGMKHEQLRMIEFANGKILSLHLSSANLAEGKVRNNGRFFLNSHIPGDASTDFFIHFDHEGGEFTWNIPIEGHGSDRSVRIESQALSTADRTMVQDLISACIVRVGR